MSQCNVQFILGYCVQFEMFSPSLLLVFTDMKTFSFINTECTWQTDLIFGSNFSCYTATEAFCYFKYKNVFFLENTMGKWVALKMSELLTLLETRLTLTSNKISETKITISVQNKWTIDLGPPLQHC